MAYEHRIYVVRPSRTNYDYECGKYWASVVAMFNLGYTPGLLEFVERYPDATHFIYDENERKILEDEYGDPLTETSLTTLIGNLESINENRRSKYVTALLAALKVYEECPTDLVVLHYGY